MVTRGERWRGPVIAAGLLMVGVGLITAHARQTRDGGANRTGTGSGGPEGAGACRVTKVDDGGERVRFALGTGVRAKVGMTVLVLRPAADPAVADGGEILGWAEVTAVEGREAAARRQDRGRDFRIGDAVLVPLEGVVTAVDRARGEIRLDLGAEEGAEVGMWLKASRAGKDAEPGRDLGIIELIAVSAHEATARRLKEEFPTDARVGPDDEIRPADEVADVTDGPSFRIARLAGGERADATTELARARLDQARRCAEMSKSYYESGQITIDRPLDASRRLMEAERDAATTRAGEVAAIRGHLGRMARYIQRESRKFYLEYSQEPQLAEARREHAEAAAMLLRANRGRAGGR